MSAETKAVPNANSKATLLGVQIDCLDMNETIAALESIIAERTPQLVVTADASALVIAHDNAEFKSILNGAALVTPDSAGIVWALKRVGQPVGQRVSGVDLVAKLCELSADRGYRLYFLGAEPGVAELAAEKLRLRYPGTNIVGSRHGYFPEESDEIVAQEIATTKPDVLLVAMGMPRQEQFIVKTQSIIRAPLSMGVGGSFDVFSGRTRRAPKLVQALHLEWFWRLLLNPKKYRKVKSLPRFVAMVLKGGK